MVSLFFQFKNTWLLAGIHYDVRAASYNPGLQYPHLHGPVHTTDNNKWDTPPV